MVRAVAREIMKRNWVEPGLKTWRRPTLPRLKTQYHQRWKLSRPSSGWDRVGHFRHNHQVVKPGSRIFVIFVGHIPRTVWQVGNTEYRFPLYGFCLSIRMEGFSRSIEPLVPVSFTHYCASTPGLSTWWSSTALKRDLVLRRVSRLDAFSGYPGRT